ncbi:MAG: VWA domain-containing protein [Sideroxydans sp.]|nr:VWA domain-containing protein [Sideroxydans sp.]
MSEPATISAELQPYWERLNVGFPQVRAVFAECLTEAQALLSEEGINSYIDNARFLGKMGRGVEPILVYLEEAPTVAQHAGEHSLLMLKDFAYLLSKSTNFGAIVPFLQTVAAVSRRLHSQELLQQYLDLSRQLMEDTTSSVHGHHKTFASPALPEFFKQAPKLLEILSLQGLKNWADYGARYYNDHPERQIEYFALQSADSKAVLQRERHGTLLVDNERKLDLYMHGLWQDGDPFIPYSVAFDELRVPYFNAEGIRLPDVYDDLQLPSPTGRGAGGEGTLVISGIDRYRAALAHIAAHRRWSKPVIADNISPFQRMAVEFFEDIRVEQLAMKLYPGLRKLFMALHPIPIEDACDPDQQSAVRHRLAMVSRAMLDPACGYRNKDVCEIVARFQRIMAEGESSTLEMVDLAISFIARTRRQADLSANVYFDNTEVDYRDDNRHLWIFIEEGDEEEAFDKPEQVEQKEVFSGLPPRHYPEWDYSAQNYRPDWVSVYEGLHPSGNAADIDRLLEKHAALAKRLKKILDLLKPQDKVRIRYQEEGSELDLDVAIRSLIDYKSGAQPDPRINMSHRNDGRSIAVMVLLDLSESLNEKAAGSPQTILELSQEAVSLLGWAVEKLGDPFAIAGFHSNTRHDVRYLHIKGYSEKWDDSVKARLAAMDASFSTRMGAAMRHAAHYLEQQPTDKKLMLILTDGQPADIDSKDGELLIADARQAVKELDRQGIYSYCINLDPKADEYVADIFGRQYTIIDNIAQLPQKLPELFISLTK